MVSWGFRNNCKYYINVMNPTYMYIYSESYKKCFWLLVSVGAVEYRGHLAETSHT